MLLVCEDGHLVVYKARSHNISALKSEMLNIRECLKAKVDSKIQEIDDKYFSVQDLVGGENSNWLGTKLEPVYRHRKIKWKDDEEKAVAQAGRDVGKFLSILLSKDSRCFLVKPDDSDYQKVKMYRLMKC